MASTPDRLPVSSKPRWGAEEASPKDDRAVQPIGRHAPEEGAHLLHQLRGHLTDEGDPLPLVQAQRRRELQRLPAPTDREGTRVAQNQRHIAGTSVHDRAPGAA